MKIVWLVLLVAAATGCASKRDFYAMSGSRADGTVDMAYDIRGPFDQPVVDMNQASTIANQKCKVWGYGEAEPFGGRSERCNQRNGFGDCINGQVVIQYQCIGDLGAASSNAVRPPLRAQAPTPAPVGKWQYQADQAALAYSCSAAIFVNSGAGAELYTSTCNQQPTTIRCEFGKCAIQ